MRLFDYQIKKILKENGLTVLENRLVQSHESLISAFFEFSGGVSLRLQSHDTKILEKFPKQTFKEIEKIGRAHV